MKKAQTPNKKQIYRPTVIWASSNQFFTLVIRAWWSFIRLLLTSRSCREKSVYSVKILKFYREHEHLLFRARILLCLYCKCSYTVKIDGQAKCWKKLPWTANKSCPVIEQACSLYWILNKLTKSLYSVNSRPFSTYKEMTIPKFHKDELFPLCPHDYCQYMIYFLSARPFPVIWAPPQVFVLVCWR